MKHVAPIALILATLLSGCQTPNPKKALSPSDIAALPHRSDLNRTVTDRGVRFELKKGDTLALRLMVSGDLITLQNPQNLRLKVQHDCIVFFRPPGSILLSFDGQHFAPPKKAGIYGHVNTKLKKTGTQPVFAELTLDIRKH